ncbi:MAG TPA: HAMP domain-containing sensor histidine kinase [Dermatophilaceae bacterium]|nr:HAMP domain-containing sensor histidine kinase [Dermatophilaceae bacterium]
MNNQTSGAPAAASTGRYFVPWMLLAGVCTVLMWALPERETIPYHIAWAGFALAYGSTCWSAKRAALALALFTAATGAVLVLRASRGIIAWQETAEIPLMLVLMVLVVWHIRRYQSALAKVTDLARRDHEQATEREYLNRLTSHEMRTPLTISRGYVEMLHDTEPDPQRRQDLIVVSEELDRLTRVTERLLRMIMLQSEPVIERFDVDLLLRQTAERWATVAHRHWVVSSTVGHIEGSPDRLRVCLDTLIENAVRYTNEADTIRIFGELAPSRLLLGVADSGPGMDERQLDLLNRISGRDSLPDPIGNDDLSRTGLGLSLVRKVVVARGGRLTARTAPEGGALVSMDLPADAVSAQPPPEAPVELVGDAAPVHAHAAV